ncbi:MAG: hypothetical protein IH851_02705 [Armatimonadetes bacterium]|nr:hypothetical protein [Armatimonadota bacterium]
MLYAFTIGQSVMYLGKTERLLVERLQNYKTPDPSQRTNMAQKKRISDLLARGQDVAIWVFDDWDSSSHVGFPTKDLAGIEAHLIGLLNPPWNGSTKT